MRSGAGEIGQSSVLDNLPRTEVATRRALLQAASDVYSPISGEVLEVNQALADKPATVSDAMCMPWPILRSPLSS